MDSLFASAGLLFAQAAGPAANLGESLSLGQKLGLILLVLVVSFGGGSLLAKWLRMPDYALKIGFILSTLLAGIVINVVGWPPKLGIDLSGGVVLVYEVDKNQMQEENRGRVLDQMTQQLGSVDGVKLIPRLNASGQIEIPLPSADARKKVEERVEKLIEKGLGVARPTFREVDDKPVLAYSIEQQEKPVDMEKLIGQVSKRINPSGVKEVTVRQYGVSQIEVIVPEVEQREIDQIKRIISTAGQLQFRIVANQVDHKDIIDLAQQSTSDEVYRNGKLVARWITMLPTAHPHEAILREGKNGAQVLIYIDDYDVNGNYLTGSAADVDEQGGLCISFSLDAKGGAKFRQFTGRNVPDQANNFSRQLAIVLDNVLQSSADIREAIGDHGRITGRFDNDYVQFVVNVLNAGSLPAALKKEPISEQKISAQLGEDTIRSGAQAMIISTIAVVVFMLVYYRFAGIVADIAVIMNMILAVALMILIKAAFTLPGLAGLVLTVGMAVDANVLIYERMREETSRGASLRMAIRNGFSRAMSTIIDSNLTTVLTAVVLFVIGTDQIKGFAVTLILGLVVSLYTAVYVARVIFDIAERQRWITRLNMMQIVGETHFDFVKWRMTAIVASLVVIGIGLAAVIARGPDLFDIDFSGGTSVQIVLNKSLPIAEVRKRLEDQSELKDISVSGVGSEQKEYKIDTSEPEIDVVKDKLKTLFGDSLATYSMKFDGLKAVQPSAGTGAKKQPAALPGTKPASETKPSTPPAKPAGDAGKKPAAEGSAPADAPKSNEGSARTLRPDSLLALADDNALGGLIVAQALAQADTAKAPAKTEDPAAADKTDAAPADRPADDASKTDDKPAAKEPADDAAETTPAKPKESGTTEVDLHFGQEINHATLVTTVEEDLREAKLPVAPFEVTNPSHTPGSTKGYRDWKLSIELPPADAESLLNFMEVRLASTPVFASSSQIGGKVAGDTQWYAIEALLASLVMIVIYVWVRFQSIMFGLAAVLALVHDVLVTVGFLALSKYISPYLGFLLVDDFKISLAVVAALLTIVGYSINDTIVIFDRIREVRGKNPDLTEKMINDSVNQTLSRTLLTSGTVLIGTLILYFIGGSGIHPFAYAMLVGLISGTYSTVYIASPVLLWLRKPLSAPSTSGATPAGVR